MSTTMGTTTLGSRLHGLVYYESPQLTLATLLAATCALLASLAGYSAVTLAAYAALLAITGHLAYRHAAKALADLKVLPKRPELLAPKTFFTADDLAPHIPAAVDAANGALHAAAKLLLAEDAALSLKWIFGLYALALLGKLLGTAGLLYAAVASLLTLPMGYKMKRAEVDRAIAVGKEKFGELVDVAGSKAKELGAKAAQKAADTTKKARARKAAPKAD